VAASDLGLFFACSHLHPWFVPITTVPCLRKRGLMLRPGKRFHFVPPSRSMSPIIAHCSYWFAYARDRADWVLLRKSGRMTGR
jgi:hypothetical protein